MQLREREREREREMRVASNERERDNCFEQGQVPTTVKQVYLCSSTAIESHSSLSTILTKSDLLLYSCKRFVSHSTESHELQVTLRISETVVCNPALQ